jgi:hypothetical protein
MLDYETFSRSGTSLRSSTAIYRSRNKGEDSVRLRKTIPGVGFEQWHAAHGVLGKEFRRSGVTFEDADGDDFECRVPTRERHTWRYPQLTAWVRTWSPY